MATLPTTTNTPQPGANGYHARIGDLLVQVAATPNQPAGLVGVPAEPPRIDTGVNPEDIRSATGRTFSRVGFAGGDGLLLAHTPDNEPADHSRYLSGEDIMVVPEDPGDSVGYATVAREGAVLASGLMGESSGNEIHTGLHLPPMAQMGGKLFIAPPSADGRVAYGTFDRELSWDDIIPGTTSAVFASDAVVALVAHKEDVYAISDVGDVKYYDGGSWTTEASTIDTGVNGMWSVKGRLLYSTSTYELIDVDNPGGANALLVAGGHFVAVVDAGEFVLAASRDGYVYALTYDTSGATDEWVVHGQSRVGPDARPTDLVALGGQVVIATEVYPYSAAQASLLGQYGALWVGAINTSGAITDLSVIRRWEDEVPGALALKGQNVYVMLPPQVLRFDLTNQSLHPHATLPGSIPNVTDPLGPRYRPARWSMEVVRANEDASSVDFERVFVFHGGLAASGGRDQLDATLWGTQPSRDTSGTLTLPFVDFYSADDKTWLEIEAEAMWVHSQTGERAAQVFPATTGTNRIDIYVRATRSPHSEIGQAWLKVATLDRGGSMSAQVPLVGSFPAETTGALAPVQDTRYIQMKAVWALDAVTRHSQVPALTSLSVRATSSQETIRFQLPVNVSDSIERPHRKAMRVRGYGEEIWRALKDYEGQHVEVEYFRPPMTINGRIESVATPIIGYTPRGSATNVSVVTIEGKEVS